jgi:spore coat protein CotF
MIPKESQKDKLKSIETMINKLQSKKKKLEDRSKNQLIKIIHRCNATKVPNEVIAGAIWDAAQAYEEKSERAVKLKDIGEKLLNPGRGRRPKNPKVMSLN